MFIQVLETGIVLNQSSTFWSRLEPDAVVIRVIVAFVSLVAMFQTGSAFWAFWISHVTQYGDWTLVTTLTWVDKVSPVVTTSMAAPVQVFLIWRCWHVTRKNWFTLVSLGLILLASVISSIYTTVNTLMINFDISVENVNVLPKIPPNVGFILALTSSAVLDVAVTIILLVYLSKARENVYSSRFRRVMRQLVVLIWEAAVPPCVCAVLTVVTYLTMVNQNWWDLMFQAILGKLYVISLFITLNGRATLAETANSAADDRLTSVAWVTSTPVRINVDVESHYQVNSTVGPHGESVVLGDLKVKSPSGSERSKSRTLR